MGEYYNHYTYLIKKNKRIRCNYEYITYRDTESWYDYSFCEFFDEKDLTSVKNLYNDMIDMNESWSNIFIKLFPNESIFCKIFSNNINITEIDSLIMWE